MNEEQPSGMESMQSEHSWAVIGDDPLHFAVRVGRRLKTLWLRWTYPFAAFGANATVHYSCYIPRSMSPHIAIGNDVHLDRDSWITAIPDAGNPESMLVLGDGCRIGARSHISCRNSVVLEADVLLGASVVIMDHNHEYSDPEMPIRKQGTTRGGRVMIERNCWIGEGAAIIGGRGELVIGRNSVIGANSVVTRSVPPFSVAAGNPARLLRRYNPASRKWEKIQKGEVSRCDDQTTC